MHRSTTPSVRAAAWLLLALVAALVAGTGCSADGQTAQPTTPTPSASSAPTSHSRERVARAEALRVLRDWDRRRAEAFVAGDSAALASLYVAGSGLAHQDLAQLRDYARRDVQVTEIASQVASAEVRTVSPEVVTLAVVERTGVVRVAVDGVQRTLAPSRFQRRVLRFERVQGTWRLSSVRGA